MKEKILTEDLILERLQEEGIQEPGELDKNEAKDVICKHYDCKIIDGDWPSWANWYFYTSTTCDSYEVFVAASHDGNPSLYDEVYYYESGWLDELGEQLRHGNTCYCDDTAIDSYEFEEVIEDLYETYWNDKKEEIEDQLIDEGYEYEDD
tara:strand:+ start:608 stop:1057 length:450 start_codon:yes stop_codon:yes gene_type:complete